MSFLNYKHCKDCRCQLNNVKFVFSTTLPMNVCNDIAEYIVYCDRCNLIKDLAYEFLKENADKGYSKIELQLKFFKEYELKYRRMSPIYFYYKIGRKHFEKSVNVFYDNPILLKREGGAKNVKPDRRFVKRHRALFDEIEGQICNPEKLKIIVEEWDICKYSVGTYYKKDYYVDNILFTFMSNYIFAMTGEDNLHYIKGDYSQDVIYVLEEKYLKI